MGRRKAWIPVLMGILTIVLLAALLSRRDTPSGPAPGASPAVPSRPVPTLSDRTTAPETVASEPTDAWEPEQTGPDETRPAEQTDPEETDPEETEPEETEPLQTEPAAGIREIFPAVLEGGDLTVRSLFQFTGMNPDANKEFGENIAGIELTNTSGRHMTAAEVTVIMTDGTFLTFLAEDVPAGRTVMVFSSDHASVEDIRSCEEVFGYADFTNDDPMQTGLVTCTADGIAITVRNVSDTDLTDLEVICHELLDSSLYGGTTYHYNVSTLPAGASTVIYAGDCFLGMVEVVRVSPGG